MKFFEQRYSNKFDFITTEEDEIKLTYPCDAHKRIIR